ncbi:dTMP kinase [Gemmatimonas sp.]|uniref:dTMP kinase n=1 Tax=Gemmatimonas sp. TaxID=1962908 RepID=UPI00391F36C4
MAEPVNVPGDGAGEHSRGLFLVLEGGEGVGKTTQWTRLADTLRAVGHDVVAVREPGGTAAGDAIRAMLLDPASELAPESEALLFAASRAQLVRDVVIPALSRGAVVLVDRFLLSTYAYQGAGRGIAESLLRAVNAVATQGVAPDLTLLLSVPAEVAQARLEVRGPADRMEQEDAPFHQRVRDAFDAARAADWQAAHPEIGPVIAIDANRPVDVVTVRCLEALVAQWPVRFASAATAALAAL